MLDTLVYILFKKLLTTGCDQGCHELLETCAMEIKRNETVWGGERLDEMKNSGMSETMRSLTRKSVCALLSLLLLSFTPSASAQVPFSFNTKSAYNAFPRQQEPYEDQ